MNDPIPVSLARRAVELAIQDCDAATPGPWRAVHCYHGGMLLQRDDAERAHIQPSIQIVPAEDADLIVAAAIRQRAEGLR